MEKRIWFWIGTFVVILLGAIFCSHRIVNSSNSIWIGVIGGSTGVLYALISTILKPEKNPQGSITRVLSTVGGALLILTILFLVFKDPLALIGFSLLVSILCAFLPKSKNSILLEILCTTVSCAIIIGSLCLNLMGSFLPLVICAVGVFSIVFSSLYIAKNPKIAFWYNPVVQSVLFILGSYFVTNLWLKGIGGINLFWAILSGIVTIVAILIFSKIKWETLRHFLICAIICGLIIGIFVLSKGVESYLYGCYGLVLFTLSMIIATAMALVLSPRTKQGAREFLKICAIFTSIGAFLTFVCITDIASADVLNPYILISLLFGGVLAYLFYDIHKSNIKEIYQRAAATILSVVTTILMCAFTNLEATTAMLLGALVCGILITERKIKSPTLGQVRLMSLTALLFMALFKG